MTRKEQIDKRASDFAFEPHDFDEDWYDMRMECFVNGAKWADKTMIKKACEWLKENKDHPLIGCEDLCLSGYLTDEFILDFKKAMEE